MSHNIVYRSAIFPDCLPVFYDRLKNEITRLTSVKALIKIASSPLAIDLKGTILTGLLTNTILLSTPFLQSTLPIETKKKWVYNKYTIEVCIKLFFTVSWDIVAHLSVPLYLCSSKNKRTRPVKGLSRALERCRVSSNSPSWLRAGDKGDWEELQRILFPNMGHLNLPKVHKWVRDKTGLKGM